MLIVLVLSPEVTLVTFHIGLVSLRTCATSVSNLIQDLAVRDWLHTTTKTFARLTRPWPESPDLRRDLNKKADARLRENLGTSA